MLLRTLSSVFLVCAAFGYFAHAAQDTPAPRPADAPVNAETVPTVPTPAERAEQFYEERKAQLEEGSTEGRFELAHELHKLFLAGFDTKQKDLSVLNALEYAIEQLETVLEIDPDNVEAAAYLSVLESQRKEAEKIANPDKMGMLVAVLGGLGIFLIGMRNLSDGMQNVAGNKLRVMINKATSNRFLGVGMGTAITATIQSSSITTVIVVGLVNSGLMALHQAIAVIMGANIGTTITAWIITFKVGAYGGLIVGLGAFVYLFTQRERVRYLAMACVGLGLVFLGLDLMKDGFAPIRYLPEFREAFLWADASSYIGVLKAALVGCLLTFIVQSSSATIGITIALAQVGVIPFHTAAALVLGENIGTTITAWLASIGANKNGKRAAYAHVIFNVIGVIWITAIFGIYLKLIMYLTQDALEMDLVGLAPGSDEYANWMGKGIALTHSVFNITNAIIFLPFVTVFAKLLYKIVPEKRPSAMLGGKLNPRLLESPAVALEVTQKELEGMSTSLKDMLDKSFRVISNPQANSKMSEEVYQVERDFDTKQHELISFITEVLSEDVSQDIVTEGRKQLRMADELESISDYIASFIIEDQRIRDAEVTLSQPDIDCLKELNDMSAKFIEELERGVHEQDVELYHKLRPMAQQMSKATSAARERHLEAFSTQKVAPISSTAYMTMVNNYRKVCEHGLSMASSLSFKQRPTGVDDEFEVEDNS